MDRRLTDFSFVVVAPLVEQHVAEAAFHWEQHDHDAHSPVIDLDELREDDRLLLANLDGVRAAGDAGWQLALEALEEWDGPGELFVCALLALEQGNKAWWKAVLTALRRNTEELFRGLVGAVLWLPSGRRLELVGHWSRPNATELMQTLAWNVLERCAEEPEKLAHLGAHLEAALHHPDLNVRAAACRASPRLQQVGKIADCLNDESGEVGVEAAIALQRTGNLQGREKLQAAVIGTASYFDGLTQELRERSAHRLERWLRYLALALPPGSAGVEELLAQLPPRWMLQFILHHGDAAWLPWVQNEMDNPECARYAGWVWSALTGIDLEENNLELPEPDDDDDDDDDDDEEDADSTDDLDPGLPLPDGEAIANFQLSLPVGQRILLGQPLDKLDPLTILRESPQALRWIATRHLELQTGGSFNLNTRAPAQQQVEALKRFAAQEPKVAFLREALPARAAEPKQETGQKPEPKRKPKQKQKPASSRKRGQENFSRDLSPDDFENGQGIKRLYGTFSVEDSVASVSVDYFEGESLLGFLGNLADLALKNEATTLRIATPIGNPELDQHLRKTFPHRFETIDTDEVLTLPLPIDKLVERAALHAWRESEPEQKQKPKKKAIPQGNFSRKLSLDDFENSDGIERLYGVFSVEDGVASVSIDYLEGGDLSGFLGNLADLALKSGASKLRIETPVGNPELDQIFRNAFPHRYEIIDFDEVLMLPVPIDKTAERAARQAFQEK